MLFKTVLRDARLAQLGYGYYWTCVLVIALFLQLDAAKHRATRTAAGAAITAALMFGQPFVYGSDTTTYGIGMSSMCALAAWSMLHFTFMEDLQRKPAVLEVLLSVVTHPMTGVLKVHKRMQRQHGKADTQCPAAAKGPKDASSTRVVVFVDAAGDLHKAHQAAAAAAESARKRQVLKALLRAVAAVLFVCICYDAFCYLLCALSNGMCDAPTAIQPSLSTITSSSSAGDHSSSSGSSAPSSWAAGGSPVLQLLDRVLHSNFVAVCIFSYAAGSVLPLQMDVIFCCLRCALLVGALAMPQLGDMAAQLPQHAFNWPGASRSISELWGFRWHQFLRFYFEGLGYATADKLLPKGKATSLGLRSSMHTVSAFFMSAVMHEYLTWAAFGTVTGWFCAFFGLHCTAVLLEGWGPLILKAVLQGFGKSSSKAAAEEAAVPAVAASAGAAKPGGAAVGAAAPPAAAARKCSRIMPPWAMRLWAVSVMLLLSPLFVEPYRSQGYFAQRAWHPFVVPITPKVVAWVQQQLHAPLACAEVVVA